MKIEYPPPPRGRSLRLFCSHAAKSDSKIIKLLHAQISMKFIMPINVVGILTFISMINTTSDSFKDFQHFNFYEQLNINAHMS